VNAQIAAILEDARALMPDADHFCKGRDRHTLRDAYSLQGAVAQVVTGHPYGLYASGLSKLMLQATYRFLEEFVPEPEWGLGYFNDTHEWCDVDGLLAWAAFVAAGETRVAA